MRHMLVVACASRLRHSRLVKWPWYHSSTYTFACDLFGVDLEKDARTRSFAVVLDQPG